MLEMGRRSHPCKSAMVYSSGTMASISDYVFTAPIHPFFSGFASLSPDNKLLALCNNAAGEFFVYETASQVFKCRLKSPTEIMTQVLPVLFVHDGTALITGSMTGKIRLWNYDTGDICHTLRHDCTSEYDFQIYIVHLTHG